MFVSSVSKKNKAIAKHSEKAKKPKKSKRPLAVIHRPPKSRPVLLVFLSLIYIVGGGVAVIDLWVSNGSFGNFVIALLVLLAGFGLLALRPMVRILILTLLVCLLGSLVGLLLMGTDSHVSFQWAGQLYVVSDFFSMDHFSILLFIILCLLVQCYILMLDNVKACFGVMPWD